MKKTAAIVSGGMLLGGFVLFAQQQMQTGRTLAATMNVFVFPQQGQSASHQSMDEAECYNWAAQNTGTDPFALQRQAEQQHAQADRAQQNAATAGQGTGLQGAARGAAGGALFGAIAGNAGRGAAIGAGTGAVVGRARGNAQQNQANQIANQTATAQQATAQQLQNFKTAFSTCLEAKGYLARF
jgi:hypothetical protein